MKEHIHEPDPLTPSQEGNTLASNQTPSWERPGVGSWFQGLYKLKPDNP